MRGSKKGGASQRNKKAKGGGGIGGHKKKKKRKKAGGGGGDGGGGGLTLEAMDDFDDAASYASFGYLSMADDFSSVAGSDFAGDLDGYQSGGGGGGDSDGDEDTAGGRAERVVRRPCPSGMARVAGGRPPSGVGGGREGTSAAPAKLTLRTPHVPSPPPFFHPRSKAEKSSRTCSS